MPEQSTKSTQLVYGEYWMHECFAILDETVAEGLAGEIGAVQTCTTVGQARRLEPTLKFTWVPGGEFEDDDGEPFPDGAHYDWSETGAAADGYWPPMPDAYALDQLPAELLGELITQAGAEAIDTTLNGSYLAIPLDREADLVHVVRSAGFEMRGTTALWRASA